MNGNLYKEWYNDLLTEMRRRRGNAWNSYQSLKNKDTQYAKDILKVHDLYQHLVTEIVSSGTPLEGENNNKSVPLVVGDKDTKQL